MNHDKAPGLDGMNPKFFQHFWFLIGVGVYAFTNECVSKCSFPQGLGMKNIVLLPKKHVPDSVGGIRPIALCNTIYKVIAKLLANRLKSLLSSLIVESQCTFVPNRLITNNILIVVEVGYFFM